MQATEGKYLRPNLEMLFVQDHPNDLNANVLDLTRYLSWSLDPAYSGH